jgi:aspartyl-tRNA(Asn)/glutamyl-tRNA(Gln) amidotransferase subunit A
MTNQSLNFMTISELSNNIRTKKVSPTELIKHFLQTINRLNESNKSFLYIAENESLKEAAIIEKEIFSGNYKGPLHGIPIGLKDLYATNNMPTTSGSIIFKDHQPNENATSVQKLIDAGSIIIGKLNMHPFAFGAFGTNSDFGTAPNPWNTSYIPGGSSSGSGVAIASGMIPAATGSDTGGSIRIPSSICGIVGIKPTYGRISRYGLTPLSWSLDTAGPMARNVKDCAYLLEAMSGYDINDDSSSTRNVPQFANDLENKNTKLTIGIPKSQYFSNIHSEVASKVNGAIEVLKNICFNIVEVDIPTPEEAGKIQLNIINPEAAAFHQDRLQNDSDRIAPDVRARLESGIFIPAVNYIQAQRLRRSFIDQMIDCMSNIDALVTPTEPICTPEIGQMTTKINNEEVAIQSLLTKFTSPFNLSGLPAISVPCGFDTNGMPIGLQIIGKHFDEATILQIAQAFESNTEWNKIQPSL